MPCRTCNKKTRGFFNFFIGGAPLISELQSIEVDGDSTEPDRESGFGLSLDLFFGGQNNHAFTIDSYGFAEAVDSVSEAGISAKDAVTSFSVFGLGYRYHFSNGIHLGIGLSSVTQETTINDVARGGRRIDKITTKTSSSGSVSAITFGYSHVFKSGFTLGTRLVSVSIPTLKYNSFKADGISIDTSLLEDIEDATIRSVGLLIGYSW